MIAALFVLLLGALALLGVLLGARHLEALAWRRSLLAIELRLPIGLTTDDINRWLNTIAAAAHAPRLSLLPCPPVALEVAADVKGIRHLLLVPKQLRATVLSGLRAALAGGRRTDRQRGHPQRAAQGSRCRAACCAADRCPRFIEGQSVGHFPPGVGPAPWSEQSRRAAHPSAVALAAVGWMAAIQVERADHQLAAAAQHARSYRLATHPGRRCSASRADARASSATAAAPRYADRWRTDRRVELS